VSQGLPARRRKEEGGMTEQEEVKNKRNGDEMRSTGKRFKKRKGTKSQWQGKLKEQYYTHEMTFRTNGSPKGIAMKKARHGSKEEGEEGVTQGRKSKD